METRYNEQFLKALVFTLKWEGGYSNHPNDSGGATNKGITQRTYNQYRKAKKLPIQSVRKLTDNEMNYIYYTSYYLPSTAFQLKPKLAVVVFDTAVHSGVGRAKDLLNHTTEANKYIDLREDFLRRISRGKNKVFLKGWINRMNDLRKYIATL